MNLKLKAMFYTVGVVVSVLVGSLSVYSILTMIPPAWFPFIGLAVLLTVMCYVAYSIILGQLMYKAKLEEMVDQK